MSWGNRECEKLFAPKDQYGYCTFATMENCNCLCKYFQQEKNATKTQLRLIRKAKERNK